MKSLRSRLTLALCGSGAVLIAALGLAAWLQARALLTAQFDDGLRARSSGLVSLLTRDPQDGVELDYKDEYMPEYEHTDGPFYFAVWLEADGRLLEQSGSLGGAALPKFGGTVAQPEFRDLSLPDGTAVRALGMLAPHAGGDDEEDPPPHGIPSGAFVVVAGRTAALQSRLHSLALAFGIGGAVGLLLITTLVRSSLRRGLAPLNQLSDLAARLDADHLNVRFPNASLPAELAPIATRLNDLLARLEEAFARERRFSADVAHELRTPIAELRALADVGPHLAAGDETRTAFFHDAAAIAQRMEATVSTLLLLARCESGRQPVQLSPLVLHTALAPLLGEISARANARRLSFTANIPVSLSLQTDAALCTRLLHLLLDNAIEYTAPDGIVTLEADNCGFTITNGPVDLVASDLPRLGERFWRKDPARASDTHAGLGLALAKELARLLDFTFAAAMPEPDRFTISLTRHQEKA